MIQKSKTTFANRFETSCFKGIIVKVGQNQDHPMTEEHYIEWIQILDNGTSYRKFLKPGDKPQAEFNVTSDDITAREYCNIHGLWKS